MSARTHLQSKGRAAVGRSRLQSAVATTPTISEIDLSSSFPSATLFRIVFAVLSLAFLYAGYWLIEDRTFRIKQIDVRGAYYLSAADVERALDLVGRPIYRVSAAESERRVLALGVPRDVTVGFRLPDVVVVSLRERTAAHLWQVKSSVYALSDDGVVLGPASYVGTRRVVVSDGGPVHAGGRVDPAILRTADYLDRTLPGVAGISPLEIRYVPDLGIVVQASKGIRIIFGDDKNLDLKVAALLPTMSAALAQVPLPTQIDVRIPKRPSFR